jgi:hypothetical protein
MAEGSAMKEVGDLLAGDVAEEAGPLGEELGPEEGADTAALERDAATAFLGAVKADDPDAVVSTLRALMDLVSLGPAMAEEL